MEYHFYKYQGTGNDFILLDNRNHQVPSLSSDTIQRLCHRKFGIGADGLMLLQEAEGYDFEMVYYNADGHPSSMCGNGGRCLVAFAHFLGLLSKGEAHFLAVDGPHRAVVVTPEYIELEMRPVEPVHYNTAVPFVDTGSPHHLEFVEQVAEVAVVERGRAIRRSAPYAEKGVNVNFVEVIAPNALRVATYERGVEDETLSCGTGVTAAALGYYLKHRPDQAPHPIRVETKGGQLEVRFERAGDGFEQIWLCGPVQQVFHGVVTLS